MKNNYKIVIIDDDELAVDNLAFELKSYQQFNVEGIAKNGAMGKKLIFKRTIPAVSILLRIISALSRWSPTMCKMRCPIWVKVKSCG